MGYSEQRNVDRGRRNYKNQSLLILEKRSDAKADAARSLISNNIVCVYEALDGLEMAADSCILALKAKFPHHKYSSNLDNHLSASGYELASDRNATATKAGALPLRQVLERCHRFMIWGIARHIVYDVCGAKLGVWDPENSKLNPNNKEKQSAEVPSLLESIGPELQQLLWQYTAQLSSSRDLRNCPSVAMLVTSTQAVLSSALREICCARQLDKQAVKRLVESEIVLDELEADDGSDDDNRVGTLLNQVVVGMDGQSVASTHTIGEPGTAETLNWNVSIRMGSNCSSTCYRCEVIQNVCAQSKDAITMFKFIIHVPRKDRAPYIRMMRKEMNTPSKPDGTPDEAYNHYRLSIFDDCMSIIKTLVADEQSIIKDMLFMLIATFVSHSRNTNVLCPDCVFAGANKSSYEQREYRLRARTRI